MEKRYSLAIVDNTDPDNLACVLALANAQGESHELLGVVVTGRTANFNRKAPIHEVNHSDSCFVRLLNSVRMENFLRIAGHKNIPVFMGCIAPHTIVPHKVHIDEREFGDVSAEQILKLEKEALFDGLAAWHAEQLSQLLLRKDVAIDVIVGGPMTDLWTLSIANDVKIRTVHAQFGMFGFGEKGLMQLGDKPRGKRQFNVACDPVAAYRVLMNLDVPIFLYPSDVTRVDAIGFANPEELRAHLDDTPATRELVRIYEIAYEKMIKPRGEKIYIHDLAPVLGYTKTFVDPMKNDLVFIYLFNSAEIIGVPHEETNKERWGEIDIRLIPKKMKNRWVATTVSTKVYLQEMWRLVR